MLIIGYPFVRNGVGILWRQGPDRDVFSEFARAQRHLLAEQNEQKELPGRILIASRLRMYAEALAAAIRARGVRSVEVIDFGDVLVAAEERSPDVILVDVQDQSTLPMVRHLADRLAGVTIFALGVEADEKTIMACADAGVSGLLLHGHSIKDLIESLRGLAGGDLLSSPVVIGLLLRRVRKASVPSEGLDARTRRELEVLVEADSVQVPPPGGR